MRVLGLQTSAISREVYAGLLQELDTIGFFTIEERAFQRAFDTPIVSVSVSIDGKFKRVNSDAVFTGPEFGVQDRFVRSVGDIEVAVGSDRWVK